MGSNDNIQSQNPAGSAYHIDWRLQLTQGEPCCWRNACLTLLVVRSENLLYFRDQVPYNKRFRDHVVLKEVVGKYFGAGVNVHLPCPREAFDQFALSAHWQRSR